MIRVLFNCSFEFLKFKSFSSFGIAIDECLSKRNKYFKIYSLFICYKKLLLIYHLYMQHEFNVESYKNNVNNLLQMIFNIYNNKFNY